jgi:aminopeptidase YwaD
VKKHKTQNVVGFIEGSKYPDSFFVFTAHYDHVGMMGKDVMFPGANDNASGTAMIIDLARHYSQNKPEISIVFIAFSGEEAGLYGSRYFSEHPLFPLENIKLLINLDMVGTGSDGIAFVNGSVFPDLFEIVNKINEEKKYLKRLKVRGEACNSDHCFFYKKGVPAFFIYSMGKEHMHYHNVYDKADILPLTKYDEIFKLLTNFVAKLEEE